MNSKKFILLIPVFFLLLTTLLILGFLFTSKELNMQDFSVSASLKPYGIGLFDPRDGTFLLKNSPVSGRADNSYRFRNYNSSDDILVIGDWNGNSQSTQAFFKKSTKTLHIKNVNSNGSFDRQLRINSFESHDSQIAYSCRFLGKMGEYNALILGSKIFGVSTDFELLNFEIEIANYSASNKYFCGNWLGGGFDNIGYLDANNQVYYAVTEPSVAPFGKFTFLPRFQSFKFFSDSRASTLKGLLPIVGDWNGNGSDSVGLFNRETGDFFINNALATYGGNSIKVNSNRKNLLPISGRWSL